MVSLEEALLVSETNAGDEPALPFVSGLNRAGRVYVGEGGRSGGVAPVSIASTVASLVDGSRDAEAPDLLFSSELGKAGWARSGCDGTRLIASAEVSLIEDSRAVAGPDPLFALRLNDVDRVRVAEEGLLDCIVAVLLAREDATF